MIQRFLEFNNSKIQIALHNGEWYVAIKPLCEALGVNYKKQHERIIGDKILSQLSTKQGMVGADGKTREMTCLPEKFIYGWIFTINSDSPSILDFKLKCYEVLYDYFHGKMVERMEILTEKLNNIQKIEELRRTEQVEHMNWLLGRNKRLDRSLKSIDNDLISGQLNLDI